MLQVMPEIQNGQLPKVVILDGCALYLGQLHQKVSTFIKMQQLLVLLKIETTAIFADRYHTTQVESQGVRTALQKELGCVYKLTEECTTST